MANADQRPLEAPTVEACVTTGGDAGFDPIPFNPSLNIRKYAGDEDPRQWITYLEEFGFLYRWADYIITRYAAMNLVGPAKTWYEFHKVNLATWEIFKTRLIQDFASLENKDEMRLKLNRMQGFCLFGVESCTTNNMILESLQNNEDLKNLSGTRMFKIAHRPIDNPHGYTTVFLEVDNEVSNFLGHRGKIPIAGLIQTDLLFEQTSTPFLGGPTPYTWSNGALRSSIDVTLASSSLAIHATRVCLQEMAFSDHLPILTNFSNILPSEPTSSWVESSCLEAAFAAFLGNTLHHVASRLQTALTPGDIDEAVILLTTCLQEACDASMKKKSKRHRERNKKHRNRSRSPRETSQARLERIRLEQLKEKMELKRQKDLMKQMETPEQKRLRRLAKKEAKEGKKKKEMGWDEEYMGYTNTDNPFGDANLLKPFAWSKKMEKEGLVSLTEEAIEKRNKKILKANKRELEKVKRRRLERERERESRDEELTRIQREKEAAQFKEWEKQEDIFHLQQAILRSKIRIEDGRAKAIDLLARYISAEEGDLTVEMNEPYIYLNGLSISDLEDLQEDIRVYKELENGRNQDYWKDLEIIAEDELHKLRKKDDQVGRRDGINPAVAGDVMGIFRGRGPEELEALHAHIEAKIRAEDEGVDIGYWETLLSRLRAFMARARLRQRHQDNLHRKLLQLKKEQGVETGPLFPCAKTIDPKPSTSTQPPQAVKEDLPPPAPSKEPTPPAQPQPQDPPSPQPGPSIAPPDEEEMETSVTQEEAEYETGGYSPRLIPLSSLEPGTLLTDSEEDWKRLLFQRSQLLGTGKVENELTKEEQAFEREARKGMVDDEASFSVESPLDKTYLWSDKYRPRKPRYFNRVHTGFEWNKYNQTHYDMDNPPPKIVQGYKFNIFYPDLIDKSITPQFFLEPCADNKDFAILRFHTGPPYEDIAFKIVNREWEYSYKRGYRCQFYNNIFQLWFHFKRYRYRR
ncbi:CACTIN [Cordylochernes scorpioides]|uniref:Splicing factor Cactin n=1 Tax=Cordylochernes scorpioides TaxID=51811 RepID=A0ABY6LFA2_9ARAC|nr:CACTIN [Cordylochernes scorpioides]